MTPKRKYIYISKNDDNQDETLQVASKQVKLTFNHDDKSENCTMMDDVDDERVVVLLDCRVSSPMLEVKMQCTSFLICKFVELNEIFNTIGHDLINDTIIQQVIFRITGKYSLSKRAINNYNNNSIPIPNSVMNIIGNNVKIMKHLILSLNERIIDQCGYLIQNNQSLLYNILSMFDTDEELLTLPLMESETAIKLLNMNLYVFPFLPLRFRKDKQIALLSIRNESKVELIDKELLLDKDISYELAIKGMYQFINVSDERNYLLAKLKYNNIISENEFEILKQKYNSDKEISMLAIKLRTNFYQYLSDELKHDIDILFQIVKYGMQLITKYDFHSLLLKDKEFILKAITINPLIFKYASEELRGDMDVILKLFEHCKEYHSNYFPKDFFQFASIEFKNNKEIVMKAIEYSSNAYNYISSQLQNDRDVILKTLEKREIPFLNNYLSDKEIMKKAILIQSSIFKFLPSSCELLNDREFILDLVTDWGSLLNYVSDEFKNDKEIVMKAILSNLESFTFASNELKNDREFNLKLCCMKAEKSNKIGKDVFNHILDVFKNDFDFLFQVFNESKNPLNIEHLPYKVRNDKTLMLSALKFDSRYIEGISDELKKDLSFIKEYITIYSDSFTYNLCNSWTSDKMIMIEILKINPKYYCLIRAMYLLTDHDILAEALKHSHNLRHAWPDYTNISNILNKEMVLNGLRCNEKRFYLHASNEIKNDREVIIQYLTSVHVYENDIKIENLQIWKDDIEIMNLVIEKDACLLFEMGSKLIENEDFVFKAVTFNTTVIRKAIENGYKFSNSLINRIMTHFNTTFNDMKELLLLIDDKQVVLEQVRKYPNLVEYSQFRNDKEIILEACKSNYNTFKYASETLKSDKEFILECSKYGPVMKYVTSTTLRSDFEFMKMACKINMMNILHYNGTHDETLEIFKECWCEYVHNSLSPNKFIKYGKYLCEHSIQF